MRSTRREAVSGEVAAKARSGAPTEPCGSGATRAQALDDDLYSTGVQGHSFAEVEVRCGRCTYQLVGVDDDPLLAVVTLTPTPIVRVAPRLSEREQEFWNSMKIGDGPDMPRGGVLWEKPERDAEGITIPCRRCHAAAKVSERALVTEARLADKKGRHLLVNSSGEIRHSAALRA